ncbi:MAG: PPC domain-containing DNA-binding protein [Desulforhopalus sp.]|jgi:predicted DNA-binding protein with PD1-like motif|nr:PPC domain-containing DNA-binding protein [Desulforhopalus sp.]
MILHALRLTPHQDLLLELAGFARSHKLSAACIVTCVGSLRRATLRFADRAEASVLEGRFEIVSLTGTFAEDGGHYHIGLADGEGRAFGGHLLPGCLIYTTAEIVLAELPELRFLRQPDPATGYDELAIIPNPKGVMR